MTVVQEAEPSIRSMSSHPRAAALLYFAAVLQGGPTRRRLIIIASKRRAGTPSPGGATVSRSNRQNTLRSETLRGALEEVHMDVGLTVGIAGAVFSLIAIPITFVLARRARLRPELRHVLDFETIVDTDDDILDQGLEMTLAGQPIARISRTYVA